MPFRAAALHVAEVVVQTDAEEHVPIRAEAQRLMAVEIHVRPHHPVREDEYRLVVGPKGLVSTPGGSRDRLW